MKNYKTTILSQYANSPTLLQLIGNINACIDPHANIDAFYNNIWNIETAVGYGLDVWGRIVNVSRNLVVDASLTYWGFDDGINDYAPFGQAAFYDGPAAGSSYSLSDDAFRALILIKAMSNISATNIPTLNKIISSLFSSSGRCYVIDLGNMKMRYTFEFILQPYELAILTQSGILAHPTGVGVSILQIPTPTFGFDGSGCAPFGVGAFLGVGEVNAS